MKIPVPPLRADGLQLDEDRGFQERSWRAQRGAWFGYGAVILAAFLGLTGSGGVFQRQDIVFTEGVASVPRVSRLEAPDEMIVTFAAAKGSHVVTLGASFFERIDMDPIQPAPVQADLVRGGQEMRFSAQGAPPHQVRIPIRPVHFGWTSFRLALDGDSRTVRMLVLP